MNERFDSAAQTWDDKPGRLEMASDFADVIIKHTDNNSQPSALEYGCGTANVSFILRDYFEEITVADASKGMLVEVRKKMDNTGVKHVTPVLMDLEKDTVNKKFDVIYTLMALHHIKDVETVLGKLSNMLNSKGVLIIGDLDKEDGNFHKFPENLDVHFGFDREYLEKLLSENKLRVKDYTFFHELKRDNTGVPVVYPLFALIAQL